jgi:hypothetical protein
MTRPRANVPPGHWLEAKIRGGYLPASTLLRNDNVRKISTQPLAVGSGASYGPAGRDNSLRNKTQILHKNQVGLGQLGGGFRPGVEQRRIRLECELSIHRGFYVKRP